MDRLTPLQKLVTSPVSLALSFRLSEGLNRLTRKLTARRRERNRAAVAAYTGASPVNGQRRAPVAALPYGRCTMDYNGCEVLAAYNALLLLGEAPPLSEVSFWFERRGLFLGGLWGTHVLAVPEFLNTRGFSVEVFYKDFDEAFSRVPAAVFAFWNDAKRLRSGLHTVALAHAGSGGLAVYNLRGADTDANREYHSITELVERTGALPVLLVAIKAKDKGGSA